MLNTKIKEIATNYTPFQLFQHFSNSVDSVFLDSSKTGPNLGEFSIIGFDPFLSIQTYNQKVTQRNSLGEIEICEGNIFQVLNQLMEQYKLNNQTEYPFIGGLLGYFGYDLMREMHNIHEIHTKEDTLPEAKWTFHDTLIVYNHMTKKCLLISHGLLFDSETKIKELEHHIESMELLKVTAYQSIEKQFQSPFTQQAYEGAVGQMKNYIRSGDIYIGNMTHTLWAATTLSGKHIYELLRQVNPAPFAAYLCANGYEVLCSSPERFLKISNRKVETRPIKGTRPRGNNAVEDEINRLALEQSEKDRSELLMIVDLERNDLSKVCKPFGVKVTELFHIERYATVFHLVANIEGELDEHYTSIDCIEACFPGGSITGAPKYRAMEVIEELEAHRRGIYTGSIGYLGFNGDVDLNIVIRTIVLKEGQASFGVGGGITWESELKDEYDETMDKAKALKQALSQTCTFKEV